MATIRALALLCLLQLLAGAVMTAYSAPSARMWDLVRSPAWDLTVRSVARSSEPLVTPDGQLLRPAGQFAIFVVDLTNRAHQAQPPRAEDFALWTARGVRALNLTAAPVTSSYAAAAGRTPFDAPVPPGATVTTVLLFQINPRASRLTLEFRPSGRSIGIDECKCDLPSPVRPLTPLTLTPPPVAPTRHPGSPQS